MAVSKSRTLAKLCININPNAITTSCRWLTGHSISNPEQAARSLPAESDDTEKSQKISKAMQAYLERARKYNAFYKEQVADFEIGKRHLANMMGQDPEFFTQKDVDEAVKYLFPSGLFEPRARPMIKHPDEVFPKRKDAEFDESGRPFHHLFYTSKANFYQTLHDIVQKLRDLDRHEDKQIKAGKHTSEKREYLVGNEWLSSEALAVRLTEKVNDFERAEFMKAIERLAGHTYAHLEKDFINSFRVENLAQKEALEAPELMYDKNGRPYMTGDGNRKACWAKATVTGNGSGIFTVNGKPYKDVFQRPQDREQLMFPLQFTSLLDKVDVEASADGGGPTGQSGAIRAAVSRALRSFVDKQMLERMRIAGLLTIDPRLRERKKPGQEGARRKYTWKKR